MRGARLAAARIAGTVALLIVGVGVSAAIADPGNGNGPPSTVPGSPGDDCSHGNSGKDCRPDPSENGKDCEDHGNARGNEDHCTQVATTTTTTTTPDTTTTNETTTTTQTTTTPGTTTTPTSSGKTPPAPAGGTASGTPSGQPKPSSTPKPPVTKPELQQELGKQAAKVRAGVSYTRKNRGELPFTGFPAWALALIGSAMLAAGLGLRRLTS